MKWRILHAIGIRFPIPVRAGLKRLRRGCAAEVYEVPARNPQLV